MATLTTQGRKAFLRARRTHHACVRERFLVRFDERELAQMTEFWERLPPGSTS